MCRKNMIHWFDLQTSKLNILFKDKKNLVFTFKRLKMKQLIYYFDKFMK